MKTILVDAYKTFVTEKGINAKMHKLLEQYPNKKIIVSNANDKEAVALKLVNLPYEFFSLKHKPDKVDPEYFVMLLEHYNLSSSDCIYFEHDKKAVDSATSVGIVSYFYDSDKKDLLALKEFLDKHLCL